jgi:hypothetical protein
MPQVPLSQLPRRLAALPGVRQPPKYRRCYNLVVDGVVGAEYRRGRWFIDEDLLPAIALMLGLATLTPAEPDAAPRRPRRTAITVDAA